MSLKPILVAPREAAVNTDTPAPDHGQASPRQRILVADDDTSILQLVSIVLNRAGYRVDTAEDGAAAWEALLAASTAQDGYALLISDNNMPKMSGVELIRKLRSEGMTLSVMLTTGAPIMSIEDLRLAAVLPKPFSVGHLLESVKKILQPGPE